MVTRKHDHGDKSLKFLLDTFGSSFSIGEIASAFCNAGRDVNVAGEILRGMQTVPSADGTRLTKASKLKTSPASMSTISTVGKSCVWRVVGSNGTSNGTMPLELGAASVDTGSSVGKNYVWRVAASSKTSNGTMPIEIGETSVAISSTVGKKAAGTNETPNGEQALKVKAASVVTSSSVREKNCFWSVVGSNGTRDGKRPLKVEANGFHVPVKTSDKPLLSRDADLGLFETSSSESNPSSDDHMEKFLFDMFGHGFQLERSTIREMLGNFLVLCNIDSVRVIRLS